MRGIGAEPLFTELTAILGSEVAILNTSKLFCEVNPNDIPDEKPFGYVADLPI